MFKLVSLIVMLSGAVKVKWQIGEGLAGTLLASLVLLVLLSTGQTATAYDNINDTTLGKSGLGASEKMPSYITEPKNLGLGQVIKRADYQQWDIDIRFDGQGLPEGSGGVEFGGTVYDAKCAVCHGDFGQGEGRWPVLAGGMDSLTHQGGSTRPEKTVGSYWPYAPGLFDYIRRTMPYTHPRSLSDDKTYGLVAYLLYLNDLVDDTFIADAKTLAEFKMPNQDKFFPDPRPDTSVPLCMENCLDAKTIQLVNSIGGVTPEQKRLSEIQTNAAASNAGDSNADNANKAEHSADTLNNYRQYCGVCHDNAVAGAPKPGDADWQKRIEALGGFEALVMSGIVGKGGMPPKGGAVNLSDEEFTLLVKYLVE